MSIGLILYIAQIIAFLYAIILLYSKSKKFPKFAVFTLWFSIALLILTLYGFYLFSRDILATIAMAIFVVPVFIAIIQAIIWTLYLRKSKRVKNTFVK